MAVSVLCARVIIAHVLSLCSHMHVRSGNHFKVLHQGGDEYEMGLWGRGMAVKVNKEKKV